MDDFSTQNSKMQIYSSDFRYLEEFCGQSVKSTKLGQVSHESVRKLQTFGDFPLNIVNKKQIS